MAKRNSWQQLVQEFRERHGTPDGEPLSYEATARVLNVSSVTIFRWLRKGVAPNSPAVREAVQQRMAHADRNLKRRQRGAA